jgi:hypothetical protein
MRFGCVCNAAYLRVFCPHTHTHTCTHTAQLSHRTCQQTAPHFALAAAEWGALGECTLQYGTLAQYEIERLVAPDSEIVDPVGRFASGLYNKDGADSWVGFDTEETHGYKMCGARSLDVGGIMFLTATATLRACDSPQRRWPSGGHKAQSCRVAPRPRPL